MYIYNILHKYYLNKNSQPSGDFEVHREDCRCLPMPQNRIPLGQFISCTDAVLAARHRYPNLAHSINGCRFCCYNSDTDKR